MTEAHALAGAPIAFDLDGTLVDTAPDLVRALNAAIRPHGLDPVPLADVRMMVGRGARALIERAFQRAGRDLAEHETDDALAAFLESYAKGIAELSRPFPGVIAALDALGAAGARLSVCTNKPGWLARPLLAALELDHRFERVVGPEDATAKKPDPAHLIAAWGGVPSDFADGFAVLVGDSEPDALAAKAAGGVCMIFQGGYSEKPAGALGADRLFHAFGDLSAALVSERLRREPSA